MRTIIIFLFSLPFYLSFSACNQSGSGEQKQQEEIIYSENVEVYYFHFERRCISCVNVQKATARVLEENYKDDLENGTLVYHEVNLSRPDSYAVSQMLDVGGQALLVVYGNNKYDLTMQGFRYASRNYDRFKETLETAINKVKG